MPILKQLVNSTNQSKRRSRADLTAEMISAPLGDFRHTMHVGRGGDAFGDTSFLSSRSGEAPREAEPKQPSPVSHKPGLLSRTFRSSKRSQSVNRGDKYQYKTAAAAVAPPGGGMSGFVKNAISLPYLNNDHEELSGRGVPPPPPMAKSVSSSPLRSNGGAAIAKLDPELDERSFGELTELPPSLPRSGGMKHAESMMSFHIDLGPSMLGDILGVMEKKGWEDDDLGYEEGRPSPSHIPLIDDDDDDLEVAGERVEVRVPPARPPRSLPPLEAEPYSPELHTRNSNNYQQNQDSCSISSSGSTLDDKRRCYSGHDGDTDSAKFSSPRTGGGGGGGGGGSFGGPEYDRDFSYMDEEDEEDEEIRV